MAQGGLLPSVLGSRLNSRSRVSPYARGWLHSAGIVCILFVLFRTFSSPRHSVPAGPAAIEADSIPRRSLQDGAGVEPVLVSYSYFEKDQIQRSNMEFFMAVGMGLFSKLPAPANTHFMIVISGGKCTPCKALMPMVRPVPEADLLPAVSAAWTKVGLSYFAAPPMLLQGCCRCRLRRGQRCVRVQRQPQRPVSSKLPPGSGTLVTATMSHCALRQESPIYIDTLQLHLRFTVHSAAGRPDHPGADRE